ncbi:hypothetical protein [Ruegeria atlantica]|uniref:hypothetical protein n=1 Tax=Ruegeria atlantica TaxID=81569 RepID=UPI00147E1E3A|nr:hypothetical protein [Ruegeria atlantica]
MISIRRRLYRERRRIVIISLLTLIAGLVAGLNDDRVVYGIPFQLAYGIAYLVILTPVLLVIALVFPSIRSATETVAFSLTFISLMHLYGSRPDGSGFENAMFVLSILFGYLVFSVYAGGWLDRYLPSAKRTFSSKVKTALSPNELWPFLVVTPDTVDTYGGENTVSMVWVDQGVSYIETDQLGDHSQVQEMMTIEVCELDKRFRGRFQSLSAKKGASGISGVLERRFIWTAKGTQLVSTRSFDQSSPILDFRAWLDDSFGRYDDQYVGRAEKLSGT